VVRALGGHSGFPALGHIENTKNIYKYIQDIYKIPGGGGPARPRGAGPGPPRAPQGKPTMTSKCSDHRYLSPTIIVFN